MRYPNCVCPNFSRFNMIVIPKKHLEMIKKKHMESTGVSSLNHSSYIPLMGFEQNRAQLEGHHHLPLRCRARAASGATPRPWAENGPRSTVKGGSWTTKTTTTSRRGGFHPWKMGNFRRNLDIWLWLDQQKRRSSPWERRIWWFDLATIEKSLKNRISPSTIKI